MNATTGPMNTTMESVNTTTGSMNSTTGSMNTTTAAGMNTTTTTAIAENVTVVTNNSTTTVTTASMTPSTTTMTGTTTTLHPTTTAPPTGKFILQFILIHDFEQKSTVFILYYYMHVKTFGARNKTDYIFPPRRPIKNVLSMKRKVPWAQETIVPTYN